MVAASSNASLSASSGPTVFTGRSVFLSNSRRLFHAVDGIDDVVDRGIDRRDGGQSGACFATPRLDQCFFRLEQELVQVALRRHLNGALEVRNASLRMSERGVTATDV